MGHVCSWSGEGRAERRCAGSGGRGRCPFRASRDVPYPVDLSSCARICGLFTDVNLLAAKRSVRKTSPLWGREALGDSVLGGRALMFACTFC